MLCCVYFECCVVCILKSHCSLLVVDVTHEVVLFFIPVINQLFTKVPLNHLRHLVEPPISILLVRKFLEFRYNMANCLISFSAHPILCRHILLAKLVLKAWSCAAIIIPSVFFFSLSFFSDSHVFCSLPSAVFLQNCP